VEGAEVDLLRGLGDLVGRVPLVIEYGPERFSSMDGEAFRASLRAHYTTLRRLGPGDAKPHPITALDRITSITDILLY
jgi:hypothetical protein